MKWMVWMLALLLSGSVLSAELPVSSQKIAKKSVRVTIDAEYPRTGNWAVDAALAEWVKQQVKEFEDGSDDPDDSGWSLDISYVVARNDSQMFSVAFTQSEFTGGAHGNIAFTTFNFLLPEGEPIEIEQVINGRSGLNRLSALVMADLKRQLLPDGGSDEEWINSGAGPAWINFSAFVLFPDELMIQFAPYQVASYASGAQDVEIPLAALKGALRPDLRVAVPSFDCGKAAGIVEHAICASLRLARLDRRLARTYQQRMGVDDADEQMALKTAQRAWVQTRNSQCGGLQAAALEECLATAYQKRLMELGVD